MFDFELVDTYDCTKCGAEYELKFILQDYVDWKENGKMIQDAFPYLNADERELLKSGICNDCWQKMFAWIDEDDEEEVGV